MFKNIAFLSFIAICGVNSYQLSPFQPFQHYLKSNKKFNGVVRAEDVGYRLGDETAPSEYDIKLKFDTAKTNFTGEVAITFQTKVGGISSVVLNGENIEIKEGDVKIVQKVNISVEFQGLHSYDKKYQKFTFNTTSPLLVNTDYIITIKYTGQLKDDLSGIYYSEYKNGNDMKKIITTHFGQFARRMMPCWDEPRFKAKFKFTVERNQGLHSISNAKLEKTEGNIDYFKQTSTISPYILALVISDFESNPKDVTNSKFTVYARPNAIDNTAYALDVGPKLITAFDEWTDMPYHTIPGVEKMELAAIPDFLAGAMENWGLILHQEGFSLYNKSYANTAQKQLIPTVISHELAHMWFGDVVTCDWFDETYLNEGFARYFQFIALDKVEPSYNGMMQFPVTSTQRSMFADSSPNSFPLSNIGMFSLPEISNMFGTISYDKGASILRMANHIMGNTKFQAGIRSYLKKRQFKTAVTGNLLTELERQHEGISDVLAPYIYQAGYPLLTVTRNGDVLNVTQKRFLLETTDHNDTTQWIVPITIATKPEDFTNTISNLVYLKRHSNFETINITSIKSNYYVFNIQQVGFYRVNYDTDNWNAIGRALKDANFGGIHLLNRAQIIDDLFNLARAGHLTYDFIFSIINYIKKETHYLPWLSFFNGLSHLHERVVNEPLKKQFDAFINDLLGPITDGVGFEDNGDDFWRMNRIQVLEWACKYGNKGCVDKASERFEQVLKGENIQSDLKPAVYCAGLRETYTNWNKMWDRYVASNHATEQEMILKALGCARNSTDINTFMDKILTKDIRLQNKPAAYISAVSGNLENVDIVLDYLIKNTNKWGEVMDVVSTLGDLSSIFTNVDQFDKFEKHVKTLKDEWKKPLLEISTENRKLLEWDTARLPELEQFLDNSAVSKSISLVLIVLITVKYLLF